MFEKVVSLTDELKTVLVVELSFYLVRQLKKKESLSQSQTTD